LNYFTPSTKDPTSPFIAAYCSERVKLTIYLKTSSFVPPSVTYYNLKESSGRLGIYGFIKGKTEFEAKKIILQPALITP